MIQTTEKFLNEILKNIDPSSFRHNVLQTAKRFKNNWYELGEKLTQVADKKLYEEWGYKNFEDYCRLEIRIRNTTAMKLTNAYYFLKKETSDQQWNLENQNLPEIESVQILEKAKNNSLWTPELYDEFKKETLSGETAYKTLSHKYQEIQKEFGVEEKPKIDWKKSARQAETLKNFLKSIHSKNSWLETITEIEIYLNQKFEDEKYKHKNEKNKSNSHKKIF